MALVVLREGAYRDWLDPLPVPIFLRATPNQAQNCPWCGNAEQLTDPRGTCPMCRLPWEMRNWLPYHFDQAEERQSSDGAS